MIRKASLAICLLLATCSVSSAFTLLDLLAVGTAEDDLTRLYGNSAGGTGDGRYGAPLTSGADCDGDGYEDYALSSIMATPLGRTRAGEVYLAFGDGTIGGTRDTDGFDPNILKIAGAADYEACGAEIWIDDVTGDGLGELIIGRQNFTPEPGREGAGVLTILIGGPALRDHAATETYLDLQSPPPAIPVLNIVGAAAYDRMGIWMRTGDVDGDGIHDIVVGSDEVDGTPGTNSGRVYVIRGGSHLAQPQTIDLANYGWTTLKGKIARLRPPPGSTSYHFGSTCNLIDLDGNGRAEVLACAALNRAGAAIRLPGAPSGTGQPIGGSAYGSLFIAWDDNFPNGVWPSSYEFDVTDPNVGSFTRIDGDSSFNHDFGEEMVGGLDFDGDPNHDADLAVGDLTGRDKNGNSYNGGNGTVFFQARKLKGRTIDMHAPPVDIDYTIIWGASPGAISTDSMTVADFDEDGLGDLIVGNPHDDPQGRNNAGTMHLLFGKTGGWPAEIELAEANLPDKSVMRITRIDGALAGDVLCYSIGTGDVNGDGRVDLIVNEMTGNGSSPTALDVGNLLVVNGRLLGRIAPADIDGHGQVNYTDFALLATRWADTSCGICDHTDLTGDGDVTLLDLLEMALQWLICL